MNSVQPTGQARGLAAACLSAALMPLNSTMIAVAVPDIAAHVHHDPAVVTQALVATYLVAAIALQSPGGKLGDRLGHWKVLTGGQVVLAVGAVLGFLAPSLVVLAVSRVLMAVGGAVVVPATLALMRLELPPERRGRAFGGFGAVMSLAAGIGPVLGGELVHLFGWRSVFLANLPVLAVSVAVAATVTHRPTALPVTTRFDRLGSVLLTVSLAAVVTGLELHGALLAVVVAAGALLFVPFVLHEMRVADPVLSFALFRSRNFAAGTSVVALLNLVMYALLFEVPLVLDTLFDTSSAAVGRILVFMMLAMVVTSIVSGRLTDRFGSRPLAVSGSLVCLGAVALMRFTDLEGAGDLRFPLALIGMGVGLANPAAQNASLAGVPAASSGMAAGISSTMRYLGGIAGVALLGRLVAPDSPAPVVLADHHTVLTVFLVVLAVCAGVSLLVRAPGRDVHLDTDRDGTATNGAGKRTIVSSR